MPPRKPPRDAARAVVVLADRRAWACRWRSGSSACRYPGSCRSRRPAAAPAAESAGPPPPRPLRSRRRSASCRRGPGCKLKTEPTAGDLPGAPLQAGPVDLRRLGRDRPAAIPPAGASPGPCPRRRRRPAAGSGSSGSLVSFSSGTQKSCDDGRASPSRTSPSRADEVDLGAVGRELRDSISLGRVERDLLLLAAGAGDQVDVGRPRDVGLASRRSACRRATRPGGRSGRSSTTASSLRSLPSAPIV